MKQIIYTNQAPEPIGPYSQAVMQGDVLYVSGQIAIDPKTGQLVVNNLNDETRLVLDNMGAILTEAGMSYSNVIKCSIFLSDMSLFSAVNEIYSNYFMDHKPARECVAVKTLPKNVNVEISCIAGR